MNLSYVRLLISLVMIVSVGCGSHGPKTYPVSGEVVFEDGVVLQGGLVEFTSVKDKISSQGTIQPNGKFRLTTIRDGDGAVAGEHRAIVMYQFADGLTQHNHDAKTFRHPDRKFASYKTSNLNFTVHSTKLNHIKITITPEK